MGNLPDETKGADHYHTLQVDPKWNDNAALMVPLVTLGQHRFYRAP